MAVVPFLKGVILREAKDLCIAQSGTTPYGEQL